MLIGIICRNVLSIDDYASCFDNIDPLARFKKWTTGNISDRINTIRSSVCSQRVQAAFVVSDPVDWSRDIQVLPLNLVDLRNESLHVHSFFYFLFSESYKTLVQYHKDEVWRYWELLVFPSIFVCVSPSFVLAGFVYLCSHAV